MLPPQLGCHWLQAREGKLWQLLSRSTAQRGQESSSQHAPSRHRHGIGGRQLRYRPRGQRWSCYVMYFRRRNLGRALNALDCPWPKRRLPLEEVPGAKDRGCLPVRAWAFTGCLSDCPLVGCIAPMAPSCAPSQRLPTPASASQRQPAPANACQLPPPSHNNVQRPVTVQARRHTRT